MSDPVQTRQDAKKAKQERKQKAKEKAQASSSDGKTAKAAQNKPQPPPDVQLSKALSYILRHGAEKEHLPVRPDGFIRVDAILSRPKIQKINMPGQPTLEHVTSIVMSNEKKRFELVRGGEDPQKEGDIAWIRAVQGHSLEQVTDLSHLVLTLENVSQVLPLQEDGACLAIHGTQAQAWDAILASQELRKMNRNHIHLAKGLPGESGIISGMRTTCTRLVYVDVTKALKADIPFEVSSNGVVLTPGLGGSLSLAFVRRVTDQHGAHLWP